MLTVLLLTSTILVPKVEPDITICIWNEVSETYECEDEKERGYNCEKMYNIIICDRLIEA